MGSGISGWKLLVFMDLTLPLEMWGYGSQNIEVNDKLFVSRNVGASYIYIYMYLIWSSHEFTIYDTFMNFQSSGSREFRETDISCYHKW